MAAFNQGDLNHKNNAPNPPKIATPAMLAPLMFAAPELDAAALSVVSDSLAVSVVIVGSVVLVCSAAVEDGVYCSSGTVVPPTTTSPSLATETRRPPTKAPAPSAVSEKPAIWT